MILGISGWWYVANWVQCGVWLGSDEMIYLRQAGGLLKGLYDHFSLTAWIRGHAAFFTTLSWCGSWSLARPHYIYLAPLVSLSGLVMIAYAFSLKRKNGGPQTGLPLWSLLPVLVGFSYHVLVRVALSGEGRGTGGYYLNFMVVPLGVMAGLGLHQLWGRKILRALVSALTVYSLFFYMVVTWAQILLYAGILFKAGDSKFYQFPEKLPAGFGLPEALEHLQALAFPDTGALLWIIGNLFTLSGVILIRKKLNKQLVAL